MCVYVYIEVSLVCVRAHSCVFVGDRIGDRALGISLLSFDSKLTFVVLAMNFAPPSPVLLQCSCVGVYD